MSGLSATKSVTRRQLDTITVGFPTHEGHDLQVGGSSLRQRADELIPRELKPRLGYHSAALSQQAAAPASRVTTAWQGHVMLLLFCLSQTPKLTPR